jgi:hypothetical protein
MHLIYSLDLESHAVKVYDFCKSKDTVQELLRNCATNFVLIEEGERRSLKAFKDTVTDDQLTEDGYFLRSSTTKSNQIDVFHRKTKTSNGWTGRYAEVVIRKVMVFGVTDASLNLPIECSGKSVTRPQCDNTALASTYDSMLKELEIKIQKRRSYIGNC